MRKFQDTSLPMEERVQDLLAHLTLAEKIGLLSTHQLPIPRLDIGEWYIGTEVARGYVSRDPEEPSTVFPQPIGMASTFDPSLMYQLGEIAGEEARFYQRKDPKSHLMLWGPTVDPERDPRWGRTEEGYGEDPFLIGEMTAAYTQGMAGEDPVYRRTIPALKHFCANNNEKNRGSCSANVTPRTLHEYYYRAFEGAVVRGGADSMMAAYNELSGVPACMNPDLQHVAERFGIPFYLFPITKETKEEQERKEMELLAKHKITFIVLARYMQVISEQMINAYPNKIINIHHSFLPAFVGAKPYHAAFQRGVKIIGATSHYVTTELDAGPIIEQDVVRITHKDSIEDLVNKGKDLEKIVLSRAVQKHIERKVLAYKNKTVIFS